jgi:hypothetical protein
MQATKKQIASFKKCLIPFIRFASSGLSLIRCYQAAGTGNLINISTDFLRQPHHP